MSTPFIGEHNFDAWIDAIDALEARPYDTISCPAMAPQETEASTPTPANI